VRLTIIAYGTPAPQGSKKFLGLSKAGRGILGESSKKVRPWRQDVKAAAREALVKASVEMRDALSGDLKRIIQIDGMMGYPFPLDCPIRARMVFTMPKPASAPKRRRTFPCRTPDLSKLARSTEDALTEAGIWKDDARVVDYSRLAKVYPGEDPEALDAPGVRIEVELMEAA
jgi:Holliday junction resolvase RusA-like endonuclease